MPNGKNSLKSYIESHEAEVINIMMALYDKESYMRVHDNRKKREGTLETLVSLVKKGRLTVAEAAEEYGKPQNEFCEEAGLQPAI